MNPSLSTVDSLLNVLPISRNTNVNVNLLNSLQRGAMNQNTPPTTNSRLNSIELDRAIKAARSSPSFNDSEPPSYFEVVGSAGFISVPATTTAVNQADHDANRYSHVPVNFRQHPNRYQSHNVTNSKEFTNIANPTANISNNRTTRNLNLAASIYQQENEETTTTSTSSNGRGTLVDPVAVAASIYSTATASGRQRSSQSAYHNHHHRAHHKPSETYMVWSVFTTFYCVFIGIFALILSLQVRNLNRKGLFDKAYARSRAVWYLNIAGLFFGIVYLTIIILFCLFPKF